MSDVLISCSLRWQFWRHFCKSPTSLRVPLFKRVLRDFALEVCLRPHSFNTSFSFTSQRLHIGSCRLYRLCYGLAAHSHDHPAFLDTISAQLGSSFVSTLCRSQSQLSYLENQELCSDTGVHHKQTVQGSARWHRNKQSWGTSNRLSEP